MFKDPKTARTVLKVLSAGVAMLAYGAIHKADKMLSEKIDQNYPDDLFKTEDQENPTAS